MPERRKIPRSGIPDRTASADNDPMEISRYPLPDTDEIIALVLHGPNDGTRPPFRIENQPARLRIRKECIDPGGNFRIAKENGKVTGTIGLIDKRNRADIPKKFFEPRREAPHPPGQRRHATFPAFARACGFSGANPEIPENTGRTHRFYGISGFERIPEEKRPIGYNYPYEKSRFFSRFPSRQAPSRNGGGTPASPGKNKPPANPKPRS